MKPNIFKKKIRVTSITLPFIGGAKWEYLQSEKELVEKLITYFENKLILFTFITVKCPGKVIDSVIDIRKTVQASLENLDRENYLFKTLNRIRKATHSFLCYATNNCEDPISCKDCRLPKSNCLGGLFELRKEAGKAIAELCIAYEVEVDDNLEVIFPIGDENNQTYGVCPHDLPNKRVFKDAR